MEEEYFSRYLDYLHIYTFELGWGYGELVLTGNVEIWELRELHYELV